MTRYRADENHPYFCTVAVLDWVPVFIDARYIEPGRAGCARRSLGHGGSGRRVQPALHRVVAAPEDWWYTSAAWYAGQSASMDLDVLAP